LYAQIDCLLNDLEEAQARFTRLIVESDRIVVPVGKSE